MLVSNRPPLGGAVILHRWGGVARDISSEWLKIYLFIIIQPLAFRLCSIKKDGHHSYVS